jgi:hypothetical protein
MLENRACLAYYYPGKDSNHRTIQDGSEAARKKRCGYLETG